jgi:TRAP-type C4-dicarboxylate transport system substrate-binding protein
MIAGSTRRFASAIAVLLAAGLARPAGAQDKKKDEPVELRFGHFMPTTHPVHIAAEQWAQSIRQASNGNIVVKVFPAEQLGRPFDHYNIARDGGADIAHVNPSFEPGRFPVIGVTELPFVFANAKAGSFALDTWYRRYAGNEMKDVRYCLAFAEHPAALHSSKKRIMTPGDVADVKVRPGNVTFSRLVQRLKGDNMQAPTRALRNGLAAGTLEAVTLPWGAAALLGLEKVTKYHIDSSFYVTGQIWVLNNAKYDSLSAAQKKVMDAHCTSEWSFTIASAWADIEAGAREKFRIAGHDLHTLTPAQFVEWRKAAAPLRAEWDTAVRRAGHDPKAVFDDLRATLAKYNSAY